MTTSTISIPSITDTLTPSQAAVALRTLIGANQPACLWGAPGIGKSDVVRQVGAALNMRVLDVRAVLLDPVDLRGLPTINGDGRAHWAIPEFLPRDDAPATLVFLDELTRAPTLVQNACFQLVLDRKLGEYSLAPQHRIVTANNRESDGGGVQRMPQALANRFVHLDVVPDLADWCAWAAQSNIEPLVIAFVRFRPTLLHAYHAKDHAFPTPRSWSFVSHIVGQRAAPDIEHALVQGSVGQAAAIDFAAFARTFRNLPSIDGILLHPDTAPVPTDVAALYAVSAALGRRAEANNWKAVLTYLDRLPNEYNVFAVVDATNRDPDLMQTQEFTLWASRHPHMI